MSENSAAGSTIYFITVNSHFTNLTMYFILIDAIFGDYRLIVT